MDTCHSEARPIPRHPTAEFLGWAVAITLFASLMFRALLAPDALLFCTDDNIGALAQRKAALPEILLTGWNDQTFIGMREMVLPSWTNALLWGLPARTVNRLLHALDLSLASFFLVAFLRRRGCGRIASAIGALTACWLGSNFTLVYAGHIGKFGVLLFASLALWLTDRALAAPRRPITAAVAAGGAWGAMCLEQPDVALFWAAALGGFVLFRLHEAYGWNFRRWGPRLIPMALTAGLIAVQPLCVWGGWRLAGLDGGRIGSGQAGFRAHPFQTSPRRQHPPRFGSAQDAEGTCRHRVETGGGPPHRLRGNPGIRRRRVGRTARLHWRTQGRAPRRTSRVCSRGIGLRP